MRPAWSVILLTTLIGAGQGLYLALFFTGLPPQYAWICVALLAAGLVASFFHLGRPERAWRTATMWRTSWLSREVIVLPAFMAAAAGYALTGNLALGLAGVALCAALFYCTGMIYACLKFLQEWHSPLTVVNYALLGIASGCTLAALVSAHVAPGFAGLLSLAALVLGAVAYASRLAALRRNASLRPKSTPASAIGVDSPKIAQRAQGFMGGSFNTREFFHGRPDIVVKLVRWTFLLLLFPVPAVLLVLGGNGPDALAAAFALQFVGLMAERWYFFAEARHPQNIYYQSMA